MVGNEGGLLGGYVVIFGVAARGTEGEECGEMELGEFGLE